MLVLVDLQRVGRSPVGGGDGEVAGVEIGVTGNLVTANNLVDKAIGSAEEFLTAADRAGR